MNIGLRCALRVWRSAAWRGFAYEGGGGFVLGIAGGVAAAFIHAPEKAVLTGNIGGLIAPNTASVFDLKDSLFKYFPALTQLAAQQIVQCEGL